jgi:hypothetical protein
MKINRSMLAAVVMVVGSLSAMGCKQNAAPSAPPEAAATPAQATPAPEQPATTPAPAPEPVKAASIGPIAPSTSPGILTGANGVRFVRPAPPALRIELPGAAPSGRHVFRRGFWQWDNARVVYSWVPGYWEDQAVAAPMAPPPVRFENPGLAPSADYSFVRGFWRFDGREYHWMPGHWEARRDADDCVRPSYVKVGGRWVIRPEHRADRRPAEVKVSVGFRGRV